MWIINKSIAIATSLWFRRDWRGGRRGERDWNVFGSLMRGVLRITGASERNETGWVGWLVNDGVHFDLYFRFRGS